MQLSMFSSEEPPANHSASRDSELDWTTRVATSCSPMLPLLANIGPAGWYGRTSPVSFRAMEDEILRAFWQSSPGEPSSAQLQDGKTAEQFRASKALTDSHGECLTLSISEWPSGGVACSLSDVLETGEVPRRYYLSPRACAGILRRADRRGKVLPERLREALLAMAGDAVNDKTLDEELETEEDLAEPASPEVPTS
jgi:hypothetical protein